MEFRIQSLVTQHASGRVTYAPLELPHLAYHAPSLEVAEEDLALAVDDRITRAHPRLVHQYARPSRAELKTVYVDAVTVWHAAGTERAPMRLSLVVSPAHKPFVEVRSLALDLRVWLPAGDDLADRAAAIFRQHLDTMGDHRRLALRSDGDDSLRELVVEATPTPLSALKRRELQKDERPPPLPDDLAPPPEKRTRKKDEFDEKPADELDDEDDDDEEAARKKKKRPATPTASRLGVALHKLAEKGELGRAWEVDAVVDNLLARVSAKDPEPVVIVGEAGAGKTAVVHELAARLHERAKTPEERRPFFHVDASRLIAGEGFFGDWQQQTYDVLEECRRAEAILYLGHVIEVLDAGKSAHSDHNVSQLLGPALAAREVTLLAEATPEEWARVERRNASFAQHWAVVRLPEVSDAAGRRILERVASELGARRGVTVAPDAVEAAVRLTRRFRPYGALVGNTVAFLRRVVDARAHARAAAVSGADAVTWFSGESGIPQVLLRDDLPLDAGAVRDFLAARVKGQAAAVERVAEVVAVIKAGLADVRRPVGVLFFAGPTGVGKTELSKALAEFVFGARDRMIRLDMGEYAGGDALARLIGDGAGAGQLTAAVRRQPFCVVLLDEVEKAHPVVFDALLGVLGEGRLTDAAGRFTDFRNAIIVMTSNLGADTLRARVGFSQGDAAREAEVVRQHYRAEAERFFRPELFNRIDDFIVFAPLGQGVLREIVTREVEKVSAREGIRRHNVELRVDARALDVLADHGFDPRYGARPLKRTLERELALPVATHLAARAEHGNARIDVTAEGEHLSLRATTLAARDEGGASRALHALEEAARLRAEVRRWTRSNLVKAIRSDVSFFTKASQSPGFWKERGLAEETARSAERSRAMLEGIDGLAAQCESLEDLAFESWYERRDENAATLLGEVKALRTALQPRKLELFATMFPMVEGVAVYLTAGRSAWHRVPELAMMYSRWAEKQKLTVKGYTCFFVPEENRPPTAVKNDPAEVWKWKEGYPPVTHAPIPEGAALSVSGGPAMFALWAEHGAHRFLDGSGTAVVKVRFEPRELRGATSLPRFDRMSAAMPEQEIRRVSISKDAVKDLRMQREYEWKGGHFELGELLDDAVAWRVFGPDADPYR
ncbi:MAG: AAA family ATPase [Polyangiales bacterium]